MTRASNVSAGESLHASALFQMKGWWAWELCSHHRCSDGHGLGSFWASFNCLCTVL
jgi:hypothetical protein